jgi:8-oxo-dGTP pyrophosphatase MutT (NUDIX family)
MAIPPSMLDNWEVLEEELLLDNPYLPVYKHKVKTNQGQIVDDFYKAEIEDAVMILPVLKNGDIVLVRQYKHGIGKVVIETVAGLVEEGEGLRYAAVRELEEETGIKVETEQLKSLGKHAQSPSKLDHTTHGFYAENVEFNSEQQLDDHENIELVQLSLEKAIDAISDGEIWVSDTVAFILKYKLSLELR